MDRNDMLAHHGFAPGDRIIIQGSDLRWHNGEVIRDYQVPIMREWYAPWSQFAAGGEIMGRQDTLMPRLALISLDAGGIYVVSCDLLRMADLEAEKNRIDDMIERMRRRQDEALGR